MCSSSGGQKLYYTVPGIVTPIGVMKFSASNWLTLINKYIEMHGQQNIKKKIPFCIYTLILEFNLTPKKCNACRKFLFVVCDTI